MSNTTNSFFELSYQEQRAIKSKLKRNRKQQQLSQEERDERKVDSIKLKNDLVERENLGKEIIALNISKKYILQLSQEERDEINDLAIKTVKKNYKKERDDNYDSISQGYRSYSLDPAKLNQQQTKEFSSSVKWIKEEIVYSRAREKFKELAVLEQKLELELQQKNEAITKIKRKWGI
jgi:hypothetical protein